MSVLIIGGTGTLGRQIVKQSLDEGYQVRCLVRDFRRAAFLKDWGAELVYGDLSIPSTVPQTLKGISIVIDAATIRSTSSYTAELVDGRGKLALLEASKLSGVKKIVYFSILNSDQNSSVPLVNLKYQLEQKLVSSGLDYTIFQCSGFFQGLINQYALPILENETIWLPGESAPVAYVDSQDAAKAVVQNLNSPDYVNKTIPLIGNKFWTPKEIVELCERLSGKTAKISYIPTILFSFLRKLFRSFEFTWNIADRLQFGEIVNSPTRQPTNDFNWVFSRLSLESYLQEYFSKIMKKLRETNYQRDEISFL